MQGHTLIIHFEALKIPRATSIIPTESWRSISVDACQLLTHLGIAMRSLKRYDPGRL